MSIRQSPFEVGDIGLPRLLGFFNQLLPQTPEHVNVDPNLFGMLAMYPIYTNNLLKTKQKTQNRFIS